RTLGLLTPISLPEDGSSEKEVMMEDSWKPSSGSVPPPRRRFVGRALVCRSWASAGGGGGLPRASGGRNLGRPGGGPGRPKAVKAPPFGPGEASYSFMAAGIAIQAGAPDPDHPAGALTLAMSNLLPNDPAGTSAMTLLSQAIDIWVSAINMP